jgi:hypothetical protein
MQAGAGLVPQKRTQLFILCPFQSLIHGHPTTESCMTCKFKIHLPDNVGPS